eukprot:scaffold687874_cov67-Attheya_sp.AAC.2
MVMEHDTNQVAPSRVRRQVRYRTNNVRGENDTNEGTHLDSSSVSCLNNEQAQKLIGSIDGVVRD